MLQQKSGLNNILPHTEATDAWEVGKLSQKIPLISLEVSTKQPIGVGTKDFQNYLFK